MECSASQSNDSVDLLVTMTFIHFITLSYVDTTSHLCLNHNVVQKTVLISNLILNSLLFFYKDNGIIFKF